MKKKTNIFFALLFAGTLAFSFGMASKAYAVICCPLLGCPGSQGHLVNVQGGQECIKDYTTGCDLDGECQ